MPDARVAQLRVELLAGHAGLNGGVHVARRNTQDAVHARKINADAAVHGSHLTFERGASAERNHRHAVRRAAAQHGSDFFSAFHEGHTVRSMGRDVAFIAPMLFANPSVATKSRTEQSAQFVEQAGR